MSIAEITVMAVSLVSLEDSFNHQPSSFSLSFSVLSRKPKTLSCPLHGQKTASSQPVFTHFLARFWFGNQHCPCSSGWCRNWWSSLLPRLAGPERGHDDYTIEIRIVPCMLGWHRRLSFSTGSGDCAVIICGLQIWNVLACKKHWAT